jgi:DNA-binding transcriptional regulator YbjK
MPRTSTGTVSHGGSTQRHPTARPTAGRRPALIVAVLLRGAAAGFHAMRRRAGGRVPLDAGPYAFAWIDALTKKAR